MMQIVKRAELSTGKKILMQLVAVFGALIAAAIVMALMGYDPIQVYSEIVKGSLGTSFRVKATLNKAIPLVILSLGIAIAFKMKFWNIGAEGQMAMGGFGCALVALNFGDMPSYLLLPSMLIVGGICGGLWALIPAVLKIKFGTSETLVTLMLNYIALKWITYLQYGPWRSAGGFPKIDNFSKNAILPSIGGVHIGAIIALVLVVVMHLLLNKSKLGYEISVIGESENTARYAGINVAKVTVTAIIISGFLCGTAGMVQSSAVERTLTEAFTNNLGFTAVITTWLGRLSAPAITAVCFLFGMLIQGGSTIQTALKVPSAMSDVIQGLIIFFILGCEFFVHYKLTFHKKEGTK